MKAGSRPQYYQRMVQMVREGAETGYLPNSSDFLRDEERAPLAYDDARHGFRLTDETYRLPPVRISRKEAFSFGLARKLLAHYEGTPLHLDMRSVLDKIAESLEGDITIEPDWLSEHVGVMPEDCVRIDPEVWAQIAGFIERREEIRATYQTFDGRISEYTLRPYHLLAYHGNAASRAKRMQRMRRADIRYTTPKYPPFHEAAGDTDGTVVFAGRDKGSAPAVKQDVFVAVNPGAFCFPE